MDVSRVNDKIALKYSTDTDNLPLMAFKVEDDPCVKPAQISISNQQFYPLEVERNLNCTKDTASDQTHDGRFKKLKLRISEYDLQERSGVL